MMTLWGGVVVSDLGVIVGGDGVALGMWAVPFTVFAKIGVINSINLIDGADGLAGAVSLVALALLGGVAHSGGCEADAVVLALVACAVVAFSCSTHGLPDAHSLVLE